MFIVKMDEIVVLDEMVALQSMRKNKIAPRPNEKTIFSSSQICTVGTFVY